MPTPKPPAGSIRIDAPLVRRLVENQFPQWAGLDITRVDSAGTDNALYRLGDELVVRLPRVHCTVGSVVTEQRWLPQLAPRLPVEVPVPVGNGVPDEGFPYPWSVYRWLPGENAVDDPIVDLPDAAARLGRFVAALRRFDAAGGPPSFRGGPIRARDDGVRAAIGDLEAQRTVDGNVANAAWAAAVSAPLWDG